MKSCIWIQHFLYLYDELTSTEKTLADNHLQHCEGCSKLFESLKENQALIQRAAQVQIVTPHAGRLTSNIMTGIAKQNKQSVSWFHNVLFRYAMMATSFMLILFFGAEQLSPAESVYKRVPEARTVTLNSSSFMKVIIDQRERKKSDKSSLYACAKSNACESELIKNYKLKKSS